ncbi:MAG TPA: MBL fold metallo-hydrolase [Ramlibacter sp.]|uniref:MBL fold metallo-hydrolase n=1 Tax=Ramlibacter sp. TaxID=1917967 RepID=UPI002B7970DE|nr:MBL fold metallo-hydrolase [Ramlibacter sp.]HVZ46601.1 MBL fold metallo-hydrolase [Ramlibacter sp.]
MTHFGAAGWRITDGMTTLLVDPYFSRVRYAGKTFGDPDAPVSPGDARPIFRPADRLHTDVALVDNHIDRADYILISHSHFNHCMDMPHIARKTGALVLGTESTMNVARAGDVAERQLITVKGGEDYAFDTLSVRVLPSLHSPLAAKRYFESRLVPPDVERPLRMIDYCEGGTLGYFVRWKSHRIIVFGSMNYIERELFDIDATIALVPAAKPRLHIHDYTGRLLRRVGLPPLVVATHWDVQTAPYGAPQDEALAQADTFVAEVRHVSPGSEVVVPRHFDTVVVSESGAVRAVESAHPEANWPSFRS